MRTNRVDLLVSSGEFVEDEHAILSAVMFPHPED
jgi:hypothetical protein